MLKFCKEILCKCIVNIFGKCVLKCIHFNLKNLLGLARQWSLIWHPWKFFRPGLGTPEVSPQHKPPSLGVMESPTKKDTPSAPVKAKVGEPPPRAPSAADYLGLSDADIDLDALAKLVSVRYLHRAWVVEGTCREVTVGERVTIVRRVCHIFTGDVRMRGISPVIIGWQKYTRALYHYICAYVTHSAKKDIMLQNFKIEFYI